MEGMENNDPERWLRGFLAAESLAEAILFAVSRAESSLLVDSILVRLSDEKEGNLDLEALEHEDGEGHPEFVCLWDTSFVLVFDIDDLILVEIFLVKAISGCVER